MGKDFKEEKIIIRKKIYLQARQHLTGNFYWGEEDAVIAVMDSFLVDLKAF